MLRLLLRHPDVELIWAEAPEHAGRPVAAVHHGLVGDTDLRFRDTATAEDYAGVDVLFSCLERGQGEQLAASGILPEGLRVIDLSGDLRGAEWQERGWVYGLPELNRKALVRGATRATVPGAAATAMNLALLPLAKHLLLNAPTIHASVCVGQAGEDCGHDSHHHGRLSVVHPLRHPQSRETMDTMREVQASFRSSLRMVLTRSGVLDRGLMALVWVDVPQMSIEDLRALYRDYYDDHGFTYLCDVRPDLDEAAYTNKCLLYLEKEGNTLMVTAVLDNVLRGGAGTAVHLMNLLFGLQERVGIG